MTVELKEFLSMEEKLNKYSAKAKVLEEKVHLMIKQFEEENVGVKILPMLDDLTVKLYVSVDHGVAN